MKKFENFVHALSNLELCRKYTAPYDVVTETGLVNLFSICFEQSWKAMKEILEQHGYSESRTGSPRMIIKLAYSAGMIQDESAWLELLNHRNEVAHSYNEEVAVTIIEKTKEKYLELFEELEKELKENWMEEI
ncbi:MAG: HI0074 family nucleotidyltransferase substrate-binding subunit [Lachnospiraceae bacterium]